MVKVCPQCGGDCYTLEWLGDVEYWKCRQCGSIVYSDNRTPYGPEVDNEKRS